MFDRFAVLRTIMSFMGKGKIKQPKNRYGKNTLMMMRNNLDGYREYIKRELDQFGKK